ncbi:MAG: hypothetical protein GY768_16465 [Planctomycetaceae bacterium]|nr:hypothetical protein [Planctomycetaceae bacterium]
MFDLDGVVGDLRAIIREKDPERRSELLRRFAENPALPALVDAIDQQILKAEDR